MECLFLNDMKNWMKKIADDTLITAINMPGTHDSACRYMDFGFISQTQHLSVTEQLNIGVRYFDFRFKFHKSKFIANHSICYCRKKFGFWNEILLADDIVKECVDFIRENPTETILFQLKEAESNTGKEFFNEFYKRYIESCLDCWFVENKIPTMGEARGKIILLRAVSVDSDRFTDKNSCIDFTSYPYVGSYNVDDWKRGDIRTLSGEKYAGMYVQDSYKSEGMHKWGTVTRFLDSGLSADDFNICLTSCTRVFVPRFNAPKINKLIKNHNFIKGQLYGIIATDYIDAQICEKIISTN